MKFDTWQAKSKHENSHPQIALRMLELHYFTQSFFFFPFPELFLKKKIFFFIWVFVAAQGLSLVKVGRGYSLDAV